ncbi:cytochrome p450 [Hirsutella rhossiliensis]|uniref:Cytochrome p450 domain-containing protein n=1 Tax=Hirsutella rhossiliensis TaxID=111463 RepID=A0A9P8MRB2_9HYPO|nr:cytochrome p450 domain-containing protein [Hirsutella rhossiliensis]KAH0960413.1 cytochrome p450 domain-containing protein [Hirsutella rhossiliensis]
MSVQLANTTAVVFSSWDLIKTHIERRSTIYSSRPSVPFFLHATGGLNASILPYGPEWKLQRAIRSSVLKPSMTSMYRDVQNTETAQLLRELLATNDFSNCLRRCIASVFLTLAYGERCVDHAGLEAIDRLEELNRAIALHAEALFSGPAGILTHLVLPQALVNRLPVRWKKDADILHDRLTADLVARARAALLRPGWNWVKAFATKEGVGSGEGGGDQGQEFGLKRLAYMVGSLYEASMAASQALRVIILAGILYPDATRRMHDELDAVVGKDRLPDFNDAAQLPYTQAFVKEAMRWRSLTPMGSPRATSDEDECRGYHIPRGATVLVNVWAMNHDEAVFLDPFAFKPERWIENPDLPQMLYGMGQRACPGRHMGQDSLFLGTARLFWAFDAALPVGAEAIDQERFLDSGTTLAAFLPHFEVKLTPRSGKHRQVIEDSADSVVVSSDVLSAAVAT